MREAAREAHQDGSMEWHNVALYIFRKRTFIYNSSALSVSNVSAAGAELVEQFRDGSLPAAGF